MQEPSGSIRALRRDLIAACAAYFASGAAALGFEVVWFHQAGLAFGSGIWASALVLSGFMAGMALGNFLAASAGDRMRRPVRAFAGLELLIAGTGVVIALALPHAAGWLSRLSLGLGARPFALNALRFSLAFALLASPSAAMGMSLPLLTRALVVHGERFGRALGMLYGINTLGAVLGAVATEAFLLEHAGVRGSAFCAGALDLLAAGLALYFVPESEPVKAAPPALTSHVDAARLHAAALLAGLALLGLELCWLRTCLLFLNDTPIAFALVLAAVLSGIGLGGLLGAALERRIPNAERFAPLVACAGGLLGLATYRAYPFVLAHAFEPDQTGATVIALSAPLVLPTALASGTLFTLLGARLRELARGDSAAAGGLLFANTLGAAVGPLIAGFVLLPWLEVERSLCVLFALYAAIAWLVPPREQPHKRLRHVAPSLLLAALVVAFVSFQPGRYARASASRWMSPGDRVLEVREGLNATHVHIEHWRNGLFLFDQLATNAYSMSVNDFAARRYMELFALLPASVHPDMRRALVIGYGIGNTAHAVLRSPGLKQLEIAEISPEILALGRGIHPGQKRGPLDDPRVKVRLEDGRQLLGAQPGRYDLITGEPPPPIMAGVSNLYSREYFALMRAALAEGGIASYWLPMMNLSASAGKAIIHAFCDAFDDCSLWHGSARNFMLLGTRNAVGASSAEEFARPFADRAARAEIAAIGFEQSSQLGALFIGDADYLVPLVRDTPPESDDFPRRVLAPGSREERDALLWQFRDTRAARLRFHVSSLVVRLFPPAVRAQAERQFENQRLINDLLFPGPTPARQIPVLHQVLTRTPLRFPALLLLDSDPDLQRALAGASPEVLAQPAWRMQRVAGYLADRNFDAALQLLEIANGPAPPLPDLRTYVARLASGDLRDAEP